MRRCITYLVAIALLFPGWTAASAANPSGIPKSAVAVTLDWVVDGDTIHVQMPDGTDEPLRMIGIDTPETVDPDQGVGCYGPEATAHLEKLIKPGRTLWIESDRTDRDRYDRLLRYVWVQKNDGGVYLLNEVMVRDGYAVAKRYPPDTKRAEQLEAAQQIAIRKGRGMWSACPGLAEIVAPQPTAATDSGPIGITSGGNCDPAYPTICIPVGSPDLDCGDIFERRFTVLPPEPMNFDGDHDGVGCEGV